MVRVIDENDETFDEAFIEESTRSVATGIQATLNELSKVIMSVMLGAIIIWLHDGAAVWAVMGSVLNTGVSKILKRILNQERPDSTSRSDPGMPSSHAQAIFFIVTFIVLSMIKRYQLNIATTIIVGVIFFFIAGYFSWLRVSQKLHTVSQVIVGALLGFIFSCLWYWSWNAIVLDAFESSLLVRLAVVLGAVVICLAYYVCHLIFD